MRVSLRPKSVFRLLQIPSLSITVPSSTWLSFSSFTTTTKSSSQISETYLRLFFNGGRVDTATLLAYEHSLVSALKACSSLSAISQGKQIHSLILKSGCNSHTFIRNSLINMYAKCGYLSDARFLFDSISKLDRILCNIMVAGYVKFQQLDNARQVFDKMPDRDCVSYTTMIMGLTQSGCWKEAIKVFKDMRLAGIVPNEVTMATLLSACSNFSGISNCLMLHVLVVKLKLIGHVLISTNLLHMYCVCLRIEEAGTLFSEMPVRNIVSWNVMLNGYAKAGLVDQARGLFDEIPDKDIISWGTMIDGYIQVQQLTEALSMFLKMLTIGISPNEVMIVDLVSACGKSMAINEGQQLHTIIVKHAFDCYDFIQATVISFYAACGRIDLADLQFQESIKDHIASWNAIVSGFIRNRMIEKAKQTFIEMPVRDVFSWSTMISGYAQSEQPNMALELFHEMVTSGFQPNEITMVSVFSAIADLGTLAEGRWAHKYIHENLIPLNDNLSASIIDMYAKCGSINLALDVFYKIRDKSASVSPWNAIICGLAMHGHVNLSLEIFTDLQNRRIKLNSITFIGVLSACCHAGLVRPGERYFKSMRDVYRIEPNIKHYGCMVDLLGRAGRLKEAENMIINMPMKPDVVIWGTLLAACRTHGNIEVGERAAEALARVGPTHGASRVLLSNIYANAGMWEDAFLARKAMQSRRMERLPGLSGVV